MPAAGTEPQTANERFNLLWEDIGAERIIIGSEEAGVEIKVDADLSIFGILDKLKHVADRGHARGEISDDEQQIVADTLKETLNNLSGGIHDKLREQFEKLTGKRL